MAITIDHLLVPVRDRDAGARWLADLLGLEVTDRSAGASPGTFAVVRVGAVTVDFASFEEPGGHHIAFLLNEDEFDAILGRIEAWGLSYSADPGHERQGELNDNEGGRGLYVRDPDGNNYELLTRTIG